MVAADLDETEFRVLELALGNYIQYRLDKMDATINNVRLSNIIGNLIQKFAPEVDKPQNITYQK